MISSVQRKNRNTWKRSAAAAGIALLVGCGAQGPAAPAQANAGAKSPARRSAPEAGTASQQANEHTEKTPMKQYEIEKTEQEWRDELTPEQFHVLREAGTERAFTGRYWDTKTQGVYACAGCGQRLYSSETKFKSGTGWPSFWKPLREDVIDKRPDKGWFTTRTEVVCSRCGGHLGHVFDDGPEPTGKRHCLNSAALQLVEAKDAQPREESG